MHVWGWWWLMDAGRSDIFRGMWTAGRCATYAGGRGGGGGLNVGVNVGRGRRGGGAHTQHAKLGAPGAGPRPSAPISATGLCPPARGVARWIKMYVSL